MARRLAEVAAKVGVSEATVSRVLNGKPGVSASTRETVLTALDVLGYERPTQLRGDRARLVGLVLPELQNPIFPALAEVVGGGLAQRGFTPVLCTRTAGGLSEAEYVPHAARATGLGHGFCRWGVRRAGCLARPFPAQLHERGVPVVLINAAVEHLGFPAVSTDDAVAIEQAFVHLRSLGHQRIGLVLGPRDHVPSQAPKLGRISPGRRCREGLVGDACGDRARMLLDRGRPGGRHPADPGRCDRHHLRQ